MLFSFSLPLFASIAAFAGVWIARQLSRHGFSLIVNVLMLWVGIKLFYAGIGGMVRNTVKCLLMAIAIAALGSFGSTVQADGLDPTGFWVTSSFSSIVEITRCGDPGELCGEVVWLYELASGRKSRLDKNNPNESLKDRPVVGSYLFRNLSVTDTGWKGRIYNPGDGRRYRTSITQASADRLRLRGCWGPFCKRQTWRRLSSLSLPTEDKLRRSTR